jgi:hypothetical protein
MTSRRQREQADLARELDADPVLRALVELFPRPPDPAPGAPRRRLPNPLPPPARYPIGLVAALAGLVCCFLAAPADQPALAVVGVVLALGAVPFLAVSPRESRVPERAAGVAGAGDRPRLR